MVKVSQQCRYAIRGVYELAKRGGHHRPVSAKIIAKAQYVPKRFMERILNKLRHGGMVRSIRGIGGGFLLAHAPSRISLGDIVRMIEGPIDHFECLSAKEACPFRNRCVFMDTWQRACKAVAEVIDNTTIQSLLEQGTNGEALPVRVEKKRRQGKRMQPCA
jgi:Rrf2 family cysteine metabolism transcriptional repressor